MSLINRSARLAQDAQKDHTSHPPNPGDSFTHPTLSLPRQPLRPGHALSRARAFQFPYTSLKGSGQDCPSTARIGRAQFHRARSASKKDGLTVLLPPSEAARCASTEDQQASSSPLLREQGIGTGVIPPRLSCAFCEQGGHLAAPTPAGGLFQYPFSVARWARTAGHAHRNKSGPDGTVCSREAVRANGPATPTLELERIAE